MIANREFSSMASMTPQNWANLRRNLVKTENLMVKRRVSPRIAKLLALT